MGKERTNPPRCFVVTVAPSSWQQAKSCSLFLAEKNEKNRIGQPRYAQANHFLRRRGMTQGSFESRPHFRGRCRRCLRVETSGKLRGGITPVLAKRRSNQNLHFPGAEKSLRISVHLCINEDDMQLVFLRGGGDAPHRRRVLLAPSVARNEPWLRKTSKQAKWEKNEEAVSERETHTHPHQSFSTKKKAALPLQV